VQALDHLIKVFQPEALPIDVEDMGSMEQTVQNSCGGHLISGKEVDPLFHRPVGSNNRTGSHIAGGDKLKKQMCLIPVKHLIPELIEDFTSESPICEFSI